MKSPSFNEGDHLLDFVVCSEVCSLSEYTYCVGSEPSAAVLMGLSCMKPYGSCVRGPLRWPMAALWRVLTAY
jgi:hypothetical protein